MSLLATTYVPLMSGFPAYLGISASLLPDGGNNLIRRFVPGCALYRGPDGADLQNPREGA